MDNKKLKSSWAAAFTVASVWFGTHVGAGFATGNQVVNYFVQYGWTAAIFPLLAMGILAVVMYIMMKFAKLNGFDNYKDTYRALYPKPWMEVFFEIFYIIIILAAVASCVDGAGGIVKSLIDLPDIICNLVIIALLILLSIFGVDLIIKASTVLSTAIPIVTAILVIMASSFRSTRSLRSSPLRTRLTLPSRPSRTSPPRRASRASGAACSCTLLSSACPSRP